MEAEKVRFNPPRDINFVDVDGHIAEGHCVGLQSCCIQLTTPIGAQSFDRNTYQNPLKIRGDTVTGAALLLKGN